MLSVFSFKNRRTLAALFFDDLVAIGSELNPYTFLSLSMGL
jgi:hypothetical protein